MMSIFRAKKIMKKEEEVCLSPERNKPWILDASCSEEKYLSSFSNNTSRSCGLCGEKAKYLRSLRDDIAKKYEKKCKDLVVYGAALGKTYEEWLQKPKVMTDQASKVVERHGTCFFQFVLDYRNRGLTHSIDGSQNLIIIKNDWLPYENNRRNVKLLKFNPHLFFPWADRAIWQDTKLLHPKFIMPSNYLLHFNRTVQHHGTCSSYAGLPHHRNTVAQNSSSPSLQGHCDAIIAAAVERPSVSDDLTVLLTQCKRYIEKHNNKSLTSSELFHQDPLVDTAFIVYDMRTSACRKFIGDFGCSWLSEIHCYSDRDQVSFPYVLASSGLNLSPQLETAGQEYRDKILVDKNKNPLVHIVKRSCHWYYGSFPWCVAPAGEVIDVEEGKEQVEPKKLPSTSSGNKKKRRVAVIVAGTLNRFMFESMLINGVSKMLKEGISIDYYISLTSTSGKAFRSGLGYTEHFQPDPFLPESNFTDNADLKDYIRTVVESYTTKGLTMAAVEIQEMIDIDSEPLLKARRKRAKMKYPDEDQDLRFPLIDLRNEEKQKSNINANRNLLRMHLAIQNLWRVATKLEAGEGFTYDYVMFMRDDSLWTNGFSLSRFDKMDGDIFVPSCDARDPPMDSSELNDHLLISRRGAADIFGNYYTTLHNTDINACMEGLPRKLIKEKRGCNSEMLLKFVALQHKLNVTLVGQRDVPFQRSANVRLPDGSNMQCFHKFCQSHKRPLKLKNGYEKIKMCKNIEWGNFFQKSIIA